MQAKNLGVTYSWAHWKAQKRYMTENHKWAGNFCISDTMCSWHTETTESDLPQCA